MDSRSDALSAQIALLRTEAAAEKVLIRSEVRESEERVTKNLQLFMLKTSATSIVILCGAMFSMFKLML